MIRIPMMVREIRKPSDITLKTFNGTPEIIISCYPGKGKNPASLYGFEFEWNWFWCGTFWCALAAFDDFINRGNMMGTKNRASR